MGVHTLTDIKQSFSGTSRIGPIGRLALLMESSP